MPGGKTRRARWGAPHPAAGSTRSGPKRPGGIRKRYYGAERRHLESARPWTPPRYAMPDQSAPLASIITPAYISAPKQGEILDETLHTVSRQTCDDYEVIVVDDGSPVDVGAIADRHPATRTLRQANAGCAPARNTGLPASGGQYFVSLAALAAPP